MSKRRFNREVSERDYQIIQSNYHKFNIPYQEQRIGGRKNMFNKDGKLVASVVYEAGFQIEDISKQEFTSFIARFNKMIYASLRENPDLMYLNIKAKGISRNKDRDGFKSLKIGDLFFNIDLNSAYWQVAYKLGYINQEMYEKYINQDSYKLVKRLCVSFLSRQNYKNYHMESGEIYRIDCDTTEMKRIYNNIREYLYIEMGQLYEKHKLLGYNIDSVYVQEDKLSAIKTELTKKDFKFKVILCQKTSEKEYIQDGETRKFR